LIDKGLKGKSLVFGTSSSGTSKSPKLIFL
jgi:hypothetical protein